jgi:hypothetical protein
LWQKLVSKLEQAKHVDGCKGGNKVFLESTDGAFSGVDTMIVRRDKLDVHLVGTDVLFNCLGLFIVHDV